MSGNSKHSEIHPPRRRQTNETGQAFIAAATTLFAEKGFNGTSIGDLANQLGLTTASLYYHVSGKQELLLRVLEDGMSNFLNRLEEVVQEAVEPREKIRLAVENHLQFVLTNKQEVAVFLRERRFLESPLRESYDARVNRYDHLFTEVIREGMAAGTVPPGDPTLLRLAILGMINWIVEWYDPRGRLSIAEIKAEMTDLIMERILAVPSSSA
ncbi:MAG: TetR/AcrR family transcriptional regulator [Actinomycetota bacterium]|nr:TetR/AcrR family transcriptional regulator [Actinomycetota bacterium]